MFGTDNTIRPGEEAPAILVAANTFNAHDFVMYMGVALDGDSEQAL